MNFLCILILTNVLFRYNDHCKCAYVRIDKKEIKAKDLLFGVINVFQKFWLIILKQLVSN